jgi:hypothetical protein
LHHAEHVLAPHALALSAATSVGGVGIFSFAGKNPRLVIAEISWVVSFEEHHLKNIIFHPSRDSELTLDFFFVLASSEFDIRKPLSSTTLI